MRFWMRFPPMEEAGDGSGGGGGGAGSFDAAKFKAEITSEFTKMLNGGLARFEKTIAALKTADPAKPKDGDGGGGDEPAAGGDKGGDPKYKALEKRIAALTDEVTSERKARTETEAKAKETARLAAIRTEIAKHNMNPEAVDDAIRYFRDTVRYNDAGELVAGDDEVSIADHVRATVEKRATWQPPVPHGGAGASTGTRAGQKPVSIDDIRPGMKAEDVQRVREHIAAVARESMSQ